MELNDNFANKVANICFEFYTTMPKSGKPVENKQWTVLSCILKYTESIGKIEVVSLGTGSKCIGGKSLVQNGDILHDSHAEVIARRGFLLYLYRQIQKTYKQEESIFELISHKCSLKMGIKFVFYSSRLPCGDATIVPIEADVPVYYGVPVNSTCTSAMPGKRSAEDDKDTKKMKTKFASAEWSDVHRTGAKCVTGAVPDKHGLGVNYHTPGQVRTKPGRGDPTFSVSCSDKLARWIQVGIQGALLEMLLTGPLFLDQIVFSDRTNLCEHSLHRAFFDRTYNSYNGKDVLKNVVVLHGKAPEILFSSLQFSDRKELNKEACPASIIWWSSEILKPEVAVAGRRQGVTKKNLLRDSSRLSICKKSLFDTFIVTLHQNLTLWKLINGNKMTCLQTYTDLKKQSLAYVQRWNYVKDTFFKKIWAAKPPTGHFCITNQ